MKLARTATLLSAILMALAACSTIARYDQVAYEHAVDAKVDALKIMTKATESYDDHQKDIDSVMTELDKAYEYDRGRDLNKITVAQWQILRDPNRDLFGGFLKMWKANGALGRTFVDEKKLQVSEAFDQIIQLEAGKRKTTKTAD